jgi:hypothetical protein
MRPHGRRGHELHAEEHEAAFAISPWLRHSADLQVIDPWNPSKSRATYAALRLQTKF